MSKNPLRVASLGMGWWSDVLADAIQRSSEIEIVSCFTRSREKRDAFAKKYGCTAADRYEDIQLYAFLREEDPELAQKYLKAAKSYIVFFERQLGEYPYVKFALVETPCRPDTACRRSR